MCLHGTLHSIPFNLICNIITFRKKKCFDPTPGGRECVYGQNMCLHGALCSISFNLICNTTTFKVKTFCLFVCLI